MGEHDPRTESAPSHRLPPGEQPHWLDFPRNVTRLVWGLVLISAVVFVADAFYESHPYFKHDGWFGFYAFYGFIACVGLVLVAKWMRTFLMRDEDYYERDR